MENIKEKAADDQDFLYHYGDVRSMLPNQKYRDGYDRIFNKQSSIDQVTLVDATNSRE